MSSDLTRIEMCSTVRVNREVIIKRALENILEIVKMFMFCIAFEGSLSTAVLNLIFTVVEIILG